MADGGRLPRPRFTPRGRHGSAFFVRSPAMFKQLAFLCLLVPAALVVGCRAPEYRATMTSSVEGAIIHRVPIRHSFQKGGLCPHLDRIDGIRVYHYPDTVLVDPGVRVLSVSSSQFWTIIFVDYANVKLKAMLRAGHEYEPKAERKGDEVTFWVEDAGTHELASDRQTAKVWVGVH